MNLLAAAERVERIINGTERVLDLTDLSNVIGLDDLDRRIPRGTTFDSVLMTAEQAENWVHFTASTRRRASTPRIPHPPMLYGKPIIVADAQGVGG